MLKKAEIIKSKQVDHVLNENTILNMIKHPFIVTHSLI
jgi:protein kinase A